LIAIDTSSLLRWAGRKNGVDVDQVREAVRNGEAALPPIVLTEALSKPALELVFVSVVTSLGLMSIREGYWKRAGELRSDILSEGYKAKLADVLIAQSCIDHDVPLITYDAEFRHFMRAGLKLA
jgi:predicted nucleic acid-binding protein